MFRSGAPSLRTLSNFVAVSRVMLAIAIAGAASAQSGSRDDDQPDQPADHDCGCDCHGNDACADEQEEPAAEEERPVWRFPKQRHPRHDD